MVKKEEENDSDKALRKRFVKKTIVLSILIFFVLAIVMPYLEGISMSWQRVLFALPSSIIGGLVAAFIEMRMGR